VIRWSAHLSMLFTELPPLQRPEAARAAGFGLVESWWPVAADQSSWAAAVRELGLGVACLNADGGDIAAGERGFCNLPERDNDTFRAVQAALDLAAEVGSPAINVLAGRIVDGIPHETQWAHAVEVLRECGRLAEAAGRIVVVEPINAIDVPGYLFPTPDAVSRLLSDVRHDSVLMLYDAYHAAKGGVDPVRDVMRHVDVIGHVQYADHPGRGAPGTGKIDLRRFVGALEKAGYTGAVGLEFTPEGRTLPALASVHELSVRLS
jgi:hydroxypyruvate isomerase